MARRKRRSALEVVLIAGFCFGLVVGGIALFLLFWLRSPVQAIDSNLAPALAIQSENISPALALMQLAGDPSEALARQALAAGHVDTSFAIAVYGSDLAPATRRALLLQAGRAFAEADRRAEAEIALYAARTLTLLNPDQNHLDRHQYLLAVADVFLAVDARVAAQDTLQQALNSAIHTPGLLPAQRAEIFTALRPFAQRSGADLLAAQAAEFARNPFVTPVGELSRVNLADYLVPAPLPPQVAQAVEQRQWSARLLAERIQLTGGIDIEPEQQALAVALLAEDAARGDAYRTTQAIGDLTPAQRLGFQAQWLRWLALKARIAHGGFGLVLVPQWQANAAFILQDLSGATFELNVTVDALSNELADPVEQAHLRLAMLHRLAQDWAFGLHPGASTGDISERLGIVQNELAQLGHPVALPVVFDSEFAPPGFRLRAGAMIP